MLCSAPAVNSADNPFSSERTAQLAFRFPRGVSWESFLTRLAGQNYCGAIVGGHGSGKTTLLEELAPRLEQAGLEPHFLRLASDTGIREKERLTETLRQVAKPGVVLLLDGAEQLSTRQWLPVRAAASEAAGFIVTVHRVSRLPAVLECETSPRLLDELAADLTGEPLPPGEAATLFNRFRGNMREALQELERRWAAK